LPESDVRSSVPPTPADTARRVVHVALSFETLMLKALPYAFSQ